MTSLPGVTQLGPDRTPLVVRLNALQSGGDLGVVEMTMTPGTAGPPLHVHPTHGEGFYVLAGDPSFQVGADVVTCGAGSWVFAPRNAPHTLANHGAVDARVLCVFAPGGFERRFERILARESGGELPDALAEIAEAERLTELVGPPLTPPA
jgi:quercetin dioxygenase-like cupin family protein